MRVPGWTLKRSATRLHNSCLKVLKLTYYVCYGLLLGVGFIVVPFAYFYFEEERSIPSPTGRSYRDTFACSAHAVAMQSKVFVLSDVPGPYFKPHSALGINECHGEGGMR